MAQSTVRLAQPNLPAVRTVERRFIPRPPLVPIRGGTGTGPSTTRLVVGRTVRRICHRVRRRCVAGRTQRSAGGRGATRTRRGNASRRRRGISCRCVSSRELAAPHFHELSHVPGDDESIEPGCRGGAISMGPSPGDLSPDVHYLLRSARLVLAPLGDDRRGSQQHRDSAKRDDGDGSSGPSMRLMGLSCSVSACFTTASLCGCAPALDS